MEEGSEALRKEVNFMNDRQFEYKGGLAIERVLTTDTLIVVFGIFVTIWMWFVTP